MHVCDSLYANRREIQAAFVTLLLTMHVSDSLYANRREIQAAFVRSSAQLSDVTLA
jgi:hypothetical protein